MAEPNETTRARMEANARSWAEDSSETMELHYQQTLRDITPKIMAADQTDWEETWKVGTKWMEKRYKHKFNVDILGWAHEEVAPFHKKPPNGATATTTQSHNCGLSRCESGYPLIWP